MTRAERRVFDCLVRNGWADTEAWSFAINGKGTITWAAANFRGAMYDLAWTILEALPRGRR